MEARHQKGIGRTVELATNRSVECERTKSCEEYAGGLVRITVPKAAQRLGISENALRKRVQRDTVPWERDDDGRVFVYLPPAGTDQVADLVDDQATDYAGYQAREQAVVPAELVESLQEQVGYLRGALDTRDKELAEIRSRFPRRPLLGSSVNRDN